MNSVKIIALAIALSSMSANAYKMMSSYDQKQDSKIDFATKGAQQSANWANEEAYYSSQQIMGIQRYMSQMNKQFSSLSKQINDVEKHLQRVLQVSQR
ncbi:hypothetical protein [Escherichia coli]|uniref:hypothetical protein n=1 Tax=Escherichia coli TaxID=562 RepID=UPI0010CC91BD|nr:hypothetical protein [Escherichia coli]GCQ31546.1 hypothetical protein BvCmsHHP006_02045 [Escherichia coli]